MLLKQLAIFWKHTITYQCSSWIKCSLRFLALNLIQTLFELGGKRLESVGDATDKADGNEDDEESGKTADDDARRIGVLPPLAKNNWLRGKWEADFYSLWGGAQCYVGAYQRARYKVSLDKGNATLLLQAATKHFYHPAVLENQMVMCDIGTHCNFFTPQNAGSLALHTRRIGRVLGMQKKLMSIWHITALSD